MKAKTLCVVVVGLILALPGLGFGQQQVLPPMIGYGHPMVYPVPGPYAPMAVATPPMPGQLAPAQPVPGAIVSPAGVLSAEEQDASAGCGEAGCEGGQYCADGTCASADCGCGPVWSAYGDFLYLRPRNKEVALAVPIDGALVEQPSNPVQVGPVAVLDPDFEPGFRVGFSRWINESASLGAEYTWFESHTEGSGAVAPPDVLRSLVRHPGTASVPSDFLTGWGSYDVDFQIADVVYRVNLSSGVQHELDLIAGGSYVNETQTLTSRFEESGVETVDTDLVFDGGGIRVGLEGARYSVRTGLMAYGRASARFVAGEFRGTYLQGTGTDPVIVDTRWAAGRVVSILDLELGIGWVSRNGGLRLTAGYMFSGWFNTVNTDEWIRAVQTNNFVGLSDSLAFDGLVTRVEARW